MSFSSLRTAATALIVACLGLSALTHDSRISLERVDGPSGPLDVMLVRPAAEPRGIAFAAHGTNSHKEVFLPLAWELAARGWALASVDSRTLSTEEGIAVRARELIAVHDALAGWTPSARLGFVGHSDGVSPALAAARLAPGARPPVAILGATFTLAERTGTPARACVGAYDQVFPAADVARCADQVPFAPFTVSWLSDHFLEQYDPVLVPSMASALVGPGGPESAVARCSLRILALALALVAALVAGARCSESAQLALPRFAVVLALFAWIAGSAAVWPASVALAAILGVLAGPVTVLRGGRVVVLTGLLMFANVVIASSFFRAELPGDLAWLLLAAPWYIAAWIPKMALFAVSVLTATGPAGTLAPPGLLALAVAAIVRPALADRLAERAGASQPGGASPRVAAALLLLMLVLWAVRLAQGMVQPEVLAAVATNLSRSLVLPAIYLVLLASGRLKA